MFTKLEKFSKQDTLFFLSKSVNCIIKHAKKYKFELIFSTFCEKGCLMSVF